MRIVGGKYRHRLISFPDDMAHTRPTKDRIREAIFSALGNIEGSVVLDLYAGSGAMGIEALSRGAKEVVFVDISPLAVLTIKGNLNSLKVPETDYQIIKNKDLNALSLFKERKQRFDLVLLDPPYELGEYEKIVSLLHEYDLLSERAILVLESNRSVKLENVDYIKNKEYHYGDINVFIYWRSL